VAGETHGLIHGVEDRGGRHLQGVRFLQERVSDDPLSSSQLPGIFWLTPCICRN